MTAGDTFSDKKKLIKKFMLTMKFIIYFIALYRT